jgi:hypothetical protein
MQLHPLALQLAAPVTLFLTRMNCWWPILRAHDCILLLVIFVHAGVTNHAMEDKPALVSLFLGLYMRGCPFCYFK